MLKRTSSRAKIRRLRVQDLLKGSGDLVSRVIGTWVGNVMETH